MAPWPGRLLDNAILFAGRSYGMPVSHDSWAIHGTVYGVPWAVERVEPSEAVLGVLLTEPWPWPGRVRQTWRLTESSLETVLEVSSDAAEFPAELGWHPWFRKQLDRGGRARLDLPAVQMFEREGQIPTGALVSPVPPGPYDDTFPLPGGRVGVTWPGALQLRCDTDCGYVVVYDERPEALCIEPQTAPPNGINVAPGTVRPGEPRSARAVWSWSPAA
jgi:aldose 1-epimerase